MKNPDKRQKVETLYILGAGASFSLSALNSTRIQGKKNITPLDIDFLKRLNETSSSNGWKKDSIDVIRKNWLDSANVFEEGLEQAIIKRVSQFEFLSNLNSTRTRIKCSNEDYLNHLTHLITAYLLKCKSNSSGNTKKFVNKVFPPGHKPEDYKNRIITYNYDTLIEKPLLDRGVSIKKIYFDRLVNSEIDGIRRDAKQKFIHPLILKLHGSANWRCKRKDFDTFLFGTPNDAKFPIWISDKSPKPKDQESPLIIPPIPSKPITRSVLFKFLWTTAFEYLHEAKNIVIIGYSCPSTDTLARAMFSHFKNTKVETISVVDPNAIMLKNYRELINNKNIPNNVKWQYYGSFNEYIEAMP